MSWQAKPDTVTRKVQLVPDGDTTGWDLDPEEAWDLGDDLIVSATRLLPPQTWLESEVPAWATKIQVTVVTASQPGATPVFRLAVICDDHGAIDYPSTRTPLSKLQDTAQTHWEQQHP